MKKVSKRAKSARPVPAVSFDALLIPTTLAVPLSFRRALGLNHPRGASEAPRSPLFCVYPPSAAMRNANARAIVFWGADVHVRNDEQTWRSALRFAVDGKKISGKVRRDFRKKTSKKKKKSEQKWLLGLDIFFAALKPDPLRYRLKRCI